MMLHGRIILLSLAVLVSAGCLFDGGNDAGKGKDSPSLVGEWESLRRPRFTLGDSLYREGLKLHLQAEGIDLDSFYYGGKDYPRDSAKLERLRQSFVWECPAGTDCERILSEMIFRKIFTEDSLYEFIYAGEVLVDSSSNPYDLTDGFLITHIGAFWSQAQAFEFLGTEDTLRLYAERDSLGLFNDTLVRVE